MNRIHCLVILFGDTALLGDTVRWVRYGDIALVDATGDFALVGDLGLTVREEGTGVLDRERTPMSLSSHGTGDLTRRRLATEDAADKADGLV